LDQPSHDRLVGIERVATAGVVGETRLVLLKNIVDVIGEASIAQRRTGQPAFRRVVEHDIEDDFDFGAVERFHHVPKFIEHGERFLL